MRSVLRGDLTSAHAIELSNHASRTRELMVNEERLRRELTDARSVEAEMAAMLRERTSR